MVRFSRVASAVTTVVVVWLLGRRYNMMTRKLTARLGQAGMEKLLPPLPELAERALAHFARCRRTTDDPDVVLFDGSSVEPPLLRAEDSA